MSMETFNLKETVVGNKFVGLWRLLSGYQLLYVIAILCVGIAALAQTGIYYFLGYFIDTILPAENMAQLLPWVALGFIGLAVLQGLFTFAGGRLAARTSEKAVLRIRDFLYDHIQRLTFTYHDNMQTGELLQRSTSDVDTVRRLFSEQTVGIGRIVLLFVVNFIALLTIDVGLAFWSIVVIPVVLLISLFFFVKVGKAYEHFQEQEASLSNRLQENLSGVRVVKAFARQQFETEMFEGENHEKYQRGRRLTMMHALYWPSTDILCGMQMLLGYYLGAQLAIDGTITAGAYIAYVGFVTQIIWPIRNLGRLIADVSTGLVSYGRILQIVNQNREPITEGTHRPAQPVRGAVRFENVNFTYEGEEDQVLHDISFAVEPGQVVALLGGTGSGKTSLVNLLPRFYGYTDGRILLDDVELKAYPRDYLRQQIGIVMQEPFLFSLSIRDNITYGVTREVTDAEVEAAARAAAVHEVILSFPNGYETMVGERGVTLSGGQKQRVTLARTFLRNPRLLILDDATSSVDTETEAEIREALDRLMESRTTFLIAHRIQSVMDADLVLVLENGRIVQRGTHATLVNVPGTYQRIYELQSRIEDELEADLATVAINGNQNGYHKLPQAGD
ncbi:ABC transporter ATP-binding protein [Candidatus Leptofilum sp.]|uniref:ABC transporter ATP-binding protein n=1 Tax=Candidatus Leptofilum sp. TaxID=3241576 RepID=UPI003B5A4D45